MISTVLVIGMLLWVAAAILGVVAEMVYANHMQYDPTPSARAMDRAMKLGFALSFGVPLLAQFVPGWDSSALYVAGGTVLAATGLAVRAWAMRVLGRRYTLTPQAQQVDHYVCTIGPYNLVRHPGYLGLLLQFVGMGLMLSPGAAVAASLPVIVLTVVRMVGEEKILISEFAHEYERYRLSVRWKLLPCLY